MFKVYAHPLVEKELEALPPILYGQMLRLIDRLKEQGQLRMPHSKVISGGFFELRVGGKDIARTIYAYTDNEIIFLLGSVLI